MRKYILLFSLGILLLLGHTAMAQLGLSIGRNHSYLQTKDLIVNKEPNSINSWQFGAFLILSPPKESAKYSMKLEGFVHTSGYNQTLDKTYQFRFTYLNGAISANYPLHKYVSVQLGPYLGILARTEPKKNIKNYRKVDIGFMGAVSFFENGRIGLFSRLAYGLIPMLSYPKIDEMGNFDGKSKGLHNLNWSWGVNINLHNEKIHIPK